MFFFNDTATTEIYTLSLHDALPIFDDPAPPPPGVDDQIADVHRDAAERDADADAVVEPVLVWEERGDSLGDRKSTRLNSSHANISYAVFCLKKQQTHHQHSKEFISE